METFSAYDDSILMAPEIIIPKTFYVQVKTLTGSYHSIPVSSTTTINTLKDRISAIGEYMPHQVRVICNGKELHDNSLCDYSITKDSCIHLVLRLRGGMYHETSARQDNEWLTKREAILKEIEELEKTLSSS